MGESPRKDTMLNAQQAAEDDPRYLEQRRRVVQLLKDQNHAYSTDRSCNPFPKGGSPDIPLDEVSDGFWNLTPEAERRRRKAAQGDPYALSHEMIAAELRFMQQFHFCFYAAQIVFLDETTNDRAYEDLQEKAKQAQPRFDAQLKKARALIDRDFKHTEPTEKNVKARDARYVRAYRELMPESISLLRDVDLFIHDLTMRLIDQDLHVVFADKFDRTYVDDDREDKGIKTNRTLEMEEKYREIHAAFVRWCEELSQKHKRFRNKAFNNTVITTGQPRSTVERAVHFVESTSKENVA